MATLWYNALRSVIAAAKEELNRLQGDDHRYLKSEINDVEAVMTAMETYNYRDHRDLWSFGTDNVHPSRVIMTNAAKAYKEAEDILHKEQREAVHPKPKYSIKAVAVDSEPRWNNIPLCDGVETGIVFIETLINRAELDADMHYWGQGVAADDQHRSLTYYLKRIPNIPDTDTRMVCSEHGGWCLIEENLFVGYDTWMKVRNGEQPVPTSWLR